MVGVSVGVGVGVGVGDGVGVGIGIVIPGGLPGSVVHCIPAGTGTHSPWAQNNASPKIVFSVVVPSAATSSSKMVPRTTLEPAGVSTS